MIFQAERERERKEIFTCIRSDVINPSESRCFISQTQIYSLHPHLRQVTLLFFFTLVYLRMFLFFFLLIVTISLGDDDYEKEEEEKKRRKKRIKQGESEENIQDTLAYYSSED